MYCKTLFVCAFAAVASAVPWNYEGLQGYNYVDLDDTHVVHSKPVIDFSSATIETQSHHGYWSHPGLYSTAHQYLKPGYGSAYSPTIFLVAIPQKGEEGNDDLKNSRIPVPVPALTMLPPARDWNPSNLPVYHHSIEIVPLEKSDSQIFTVDGEFEEQGNTEFLPSAPVLSAEEPVFGDTVIDVQLPVQTSESEVMKMNEKIEGENTNGENMEMEPVPDMKTTGEMSPAVEQVPSETMTLGGEISGMEEQMPAEIKTSGEMSGMEEQMPAEIKTSGEISGMEKQMPAEIKTSGEMPGMEEQMPAEIKTSGEMPGMEEKPAEGTKTSGEVTGMEQISAQTSSGLENLPVDTMTSGVVNSGLGETSDDKKMPEEEETVGQEGQEKLPAEMKTSGEMAEAVLPVDTKTEVITEEEQTPVVDASPLSSPVAEGFEQVPQVAEEAVPLMKPADPVAAKIESDETMSDKEYDGDTFPKDEQN